MSPQAELGEPATAQSIAFRIAASIAPASPASAGIGRAQAPSRGKLEGSILPRTS